MNRWTYPLLAGLLVFSLAPAHALFNLSQNQQQTLVIQSTTTVAVETSNNTSASNNFAGQNNGNLAATNISKVDTRTMLYNGSTTQIFAHFMAWFCMPHSDHCSCGTGDDGIYRCNGHILTQYNSNDAQQVHAQVDDMISRSIPGMIVDWYGSGDYIINETTKKVRTEAQTHSPSQFQFIVMVDGGQYSHCNGDPGCIQSGLISDLNYLGTTFLPSPNYGKAPNGNPYVFFFNSESGINWDTVANSVSQYHFQFVFENTSGFTHAHTAGAFSWIDPHHPENDDWEGYLDNFYSTAKTKEGQNHNLHTFGSTFKGFDDHLAGWGSDRLITQHCGQVWQKTFTHINNNYSQSTPLDNIQMPTWNDYDEGTEIESGIDNCVSITASVNNQASLLSWQMTGDVSTLDHFTVYASTDDFNLMVLQDNIAPTLTSLGLSSYNLPSNTYLRVKAVGKPTMANHLSQAGVELSGSGGYSGGIQGVIQSAIDQHPIANATVSYSLGRTTTDSQGHYSLSHVPPGSYTVTASASGWLPNSALVTVSNTVVTQNIEIATAGKVSGTVTNGLGQPMRGVNVICNGGVLPTHVSYLTDSNGNYASSWIPVGNYTCMATLAGSAFGLTEPMTITAGNNTRLNFQL